MNSRGIVLMILMLSGCNALNIRGPAATVESPEILTRENERASFYLRSEPNVRIHLVDDPSARPIKVQSPPDFGNEADFNGGFRWVAVPKLQVSAAVSPSIVNFTYGTQYALRLAAQYQLAGESYQNRPSEGWSTSVFSHLNYSEANKSGDQKEFLGEGGYNWWAKAQFRGVDVGTSVGYRVNPKNLLFLGVAHEFFDVGGEVHQDASRDGTYPAASAQIDRTSGTSSAVAAGWSWGRKNRLEVVASYLKNRWNGFETDQYFVSIGFSAAHFDSPPAVVEPTPTKSTED